MTITNVVDDDERRDEKVKSEMNCVLGWDGTASID